MALSAPGAPGAPAAAAALAAATPLSAAERDADERREITVELCRALDSVSVAKPAAMRVLSVVDNPNTNAQMVAQAIELDPTFAAQIMRLGNSAYYGMSGKVGNTGFAVSVIGFAAVRSMAAISATGLSTQSAIPDGFWRHAAAAAAGASVVAPRLGLPAADCFAAGLLHDVGTAFLHGFDQPGHLALIAEHGTDGAGLAAAEADRYGMGHDAAAAHVLSAWKFPLPFVEAVAWHHHATEGNALADAVRTGDLLALLSEGLGDALIVSELVEAGIPEEEQEELVIATGDRAAEILSTLPI